MLYLNKDWVKNRQEWIKENISVPEFDYDNMRASTWAAPKWVHFGAGNIFRGYIARLQNTLLNEKSEETGIIACEAFDHDFIRPVYDDHDNLSLSVNIHLDGNLDITLTGSIADCLDLRPDAADNFRKLCDIFQKPSLQIVSFTITETGYRIKDQKGNILPEVLSDLQQDNLPELKTRHTMGIITELLYIRFLAGRFPVTLLSLDNCAQNGDKLKAAVLFIAEEWVKRGIVPDEFIDYLNDRSLIAFPYSMIDKITPMPSEWVQEELEKRGFTDLPIIHTKHNTVIAPFVNAEVPEYLVIEDWFTNGRPALEKTGVMFSDRETVNKSERMKVTVCLNPLMTALGVLGCLFSCESLSEEMEDPDIRKFLERLSYQEGMPIVENPGIIDPKTFLEEVLTQRLPNPYIPDTPKRTALDISQKMPNRFGLMIKTYHNNPELDEKNLRCTSFLIAAWCRYLLGIDDKGNPMEIVREPLLPELKKALEKVSFNNPASYTDQLYPILSNQDIFSLNLYDTALPEIIETDFCYMLKGPGMVRKLLQQILI